MTIPTTASLLSGLWPLLQCLCLQSTCHLPDAACLIVPIWLPFEQLRCYPYCSPCVSVVQLASALIRATCHWHGNNSTTRQSQLDTLDQNSDQDRVCFVQGEHDFSHFPRSGCCSSSVYSRNVTGMMVSVVHLFSVTSGVQQERDGRPRGYEKELMTINMKCEREQWKESEHRHFCSV